MVLSDGKTDSIGKTLTQRTSGNFNTVSAMSLGMAGGNGINVLKMRMLVPVVWSQIGISTDSETFDIIERKLVIAEMKESIL